MSKRSNRSPGEGSIYLTKDGRYLGSIHVTDPRTGQDITTVDALADYVGQFTESAPGWTAAVTESKGYGDHRRVFVAFRDNGEARQPGTYYAHLRDGRIATLVGFAGAGGPAA